MITPRRFTADPAKNARNVAERGIDLVEGGKVFDFATAVTAIDDRRDYGEVRQVAAGFIGPRLHILVFTMRGSLRKANKREIRSYVRQIEEME